MVNNFKGKKVLVMGLGLHGGAVAVVKWLLKNKAQLTVTDIKTKAELKLSLDKLKNAKIKYTLGKHDLKDFKDQDLIVQNPGVPSQNKYLKQARRQGIPIVNEAVMFFGLFNGNVIGITGTRGKSTTASLLHHILKTEIKNNILAGNIATTPMLSVVDKAKKDSWPVLELSSWQLEGLGEYKRSPQIAVVTNVMRDHLNRYRSLTEYRKAKELIVKYQTKNDIAVLNADNKYTKDFKTKAKTYYFSLNPSTMLRAGKKVKGCYLKDNWLHFYDGQQVGRVMTLKEVKLLGQHNQQNILAAVTVAKLLGLSNKKIAQAVNSFSGVDYRLEYKGKVKGIEVYNDSTSTTPDATLAALRSLPDKSVVLIAGGEDKQLDYKQLAKQIKQQVNYLLLLSGSGSNKLIKELEVINYPDFKIVTNIDDLKTAWHLALKYSSGDDQCILFSPAAASFNMFINEFDRARQFDKLLNGQKKTKK